MSKAVKITLGRTGNAECRVVDPDTGAAIGSVRKVTIIAEFGQPTKAVIELVAVTAEAEADATIISPEVIDRIVEDAVALQSEDLPDNADLHLSKVELQRLLGRRLLGEPT